MALNLARTLIPLDEMSAVYRAARKRYFVAIMRQHPDVWEVHKRNLQFKLIDGVVAREAVKHCGVQAARARVIGRLLGLSLRIRFALEKAAFLHDSYKGEEIRYLRAHGNTWDAYLEPQHRASASWRNHGLFSRLVMQTAGAVAHKSLPLMRVLCRQVQQQGVESLSPTQIALLAMHYLDDVAVNDQWAIPASNGENVLDQRMRRNAANPDYQQLNEAGRTRLRQLANDQGFGEYGFFTDGRTTYEEQQITGHMVEDVLAQLIMQRHGVDFDPLDLPVIIDNAIREELVALANEIAAQWAVQAA